MPNPIDVVLGGVGSAIGDAAASGANAVMQEIWNFTVGLLAGAFKWIDKLGAPNVDAAGPIAGILPTTLWLGLFVLILLSFVQIGRAVLDGGKGFVTLLMGMAQYSLITTGALGVLAVLVTAADALALGLLQSGLKIDNWQGITTQNSAFTNVAHGAGGVGLGLIALFVLVPSVIGLVVETLVRHASILVLAATIPLIAAGLVQESTTRWFWTALRWMIALLMLTPAVALVMVIGLRTAAGAAGADGAAQPGGQASVQILVSGVVMVISLLCPLALFKLFAFVDPATVSGARMRGFFGSGAQNDGGSAPAVEGAGGNGSDAATANRFEGALGGGANALRGAASDAATAASGILDAAGAGHQGTPQAAGKHSTPQGRAEGHAHTDEDTDDASSPETASEETKVPPNPAPSTSNSTAPEADPTPAPADGVASGTGHAEPPANTPTCEAIDHHVPPATGEGSSEVGSAAAGAGEAEAAAAVVVL